MQYNIHPIVVHFPIVCLTLYSLIKIIPFSRWFPNFSWKQIGQFLLVVGFLGALVASSTGEVAEHMVRPNSDIVHTHSFFASVSSWIYGLLLLGEILPFLNIKIIPQISFSPLTKAGIVLERILNKNRIVKVFSILGLVAIFVTGLLGGVMVYGTSSDPLAPFVLKILGLEI